MSYYLSLVFPETVSEKKIWGQVIYEGGTSRRNEKERQGREGGRPSKGRDSGSVLLGLTLNPEDSSEAF